jgi:hypothetical protein
MIQAQIKHRNQANSIVLSEIGFNSEGRNVWSPFCFEKAV